MSDRNFALSRGYLARNLDVCNAIGLNAGLCSVRDRMRERKDCPAWFLEKMEEMIERSDKLIRPVVEHRDELPVDPRDVRGYVGTKDVGGDTGAR
jgi:hypothetical protein